MPLMILVLNLTIGPCQPGSMTFFLHLKNQNMILWFLTHIDIRSQTNKNGSSFWLVLLDLRVWSHLLTIYGQNHKGLLRRVSHGLDGLGHLTNLVFGLKTIQTICIELTIRTKTSVKPSASNPDCNITNSYFGLTGLTQNPLVPYIPTCLDFLSPITHTGCTWGLPCEYQPIWSQWNL